MYKEMDQEVRGGVWSDDEVKCLIAVWGDKSIQQQLDGAVRNKEIFDNIAKEMRRNGYERDWQQCRTKTKNLKQTYNKNKRRE